MANQQISSENVPLHAHWDCSYGVSGYSMLAACLDAMAKEEAQRQLLVLEDLILKDSLQIVAVTKFSLQLRRVASAMQVLVVRKRVLEVDSKEHEAASLGVEDMPQINGYQVKKMFEKADAGKIPNWVREKSIEVLHEMGKAASSVVRTDSLDIANIDYGLDMIIEVVGTLLSLNYLGARTASCGPIPLGSGSAAMTMPQPAPLTLKLLIGMPTYPGPQNLNGEFVNAAGAALLRVLTGASRFQKVKQQQAMVLRSVGFGTSNTHHIVRLSLGEVDSPAPTEVYRHAPSLDLTSPQWDVDTLTHMEANLDDITAENLSFTVDRLIANGAVDAWVVPIIMKKGRAAHTLNCLCRSDNETELKIKNLLQLIFEQTTTLGVRIHRNISRVALRRSFLTVQTPFISSETNGSVAVKVGYMGSKPVSVKPEFEHCKEISLQTGVPLKRVSEVALHQAYIQLGRGNQVIIKNNKR